MISGIIKPGKKHECKMPIAMFKESGTLYRCGGCGKVYVLGGFISPINGLRRSKWTEVSIEEWVAAGGSR